MSDDLTEEERERFIVDNDDKADWALRKLADAQDERDRIEHNARTQIARIEANLADDLRPLDHDISFFEGLLIRYRDQLEQEKPGRTTGYKLTFGTLKRNPGRPSTKVTDEAAFLAWATAEAPDAVKVTPLVSALADWVRKDDGSIVSPDGEVVPGVEVQPGTAKYAVTLKPRDEM